MVVFQCCWEIIKKKKKTFFCKNIAFAFILDWNLDTWTEHSSFGFGALRWDPGNRLHYLPVPEEGPCAHVKGGRACSAYAGSGFETENTTIRMLLFWDQISEYLKLQNLPAFYESSCSLKRNTVATQTHPGQYRPRLFLWNVGFKIQCNLLLKRNKAGVCQQSSCSYSASGKYNFALFDETPHSFRITDTAKLYLAPQGLPLIHDFKSKLLKFCERKKIHLGYADIVTNWDRETILLC